MAKFDISSLINHAEKELGADIANGELLAAFRSGRLKPTFEDGAPRYDTAEVEAWIAEVKANRKTFWENFQSTVQALKPVGKGFSDMTQVN